jgi:hypothetical protein
VENNRVQRLDTMAPRKSPKATGESSSQNANGLFDTSPRSIDTIKSWTHISNILLYELVNCPDDSSDNEKEDLATKYKIIAQSELHKIAARPRLLQ